MTVLESANSGFRFALELCGLAALGYWGFQASDSLPMQVLLGLGAPLGFAFNWGAFIGPRAPNRLDDPARLSLEVTLFGFAAIGLLAADEGLLAVALVIAVAVNLGLMVFLGQRGRGGI
jgi:hypothetical protein